MAFGYYHDLGLSSPVNAQNPLRFTAGHSGSTGNVDKVIYFGDPIPGRIMTNGDNPEDTIHLYVNDTDPDAGQPPAAIRVALSEQQLPTASSDADLGVMQLDSGVENAVAVYLRFNVTENANNVEGVYTDLTLSYSTPVVT